MKKIITGLFMLFTTTVFAGELTNQYVKWLVIPKNVTSDQAATWLKAAMVHGQIPNASVRSDCGDYITVWTRELYDEVKNASNDRFEIVLSEPGEVKNNWGIGVKSGDATPLGELPGGVYVILFTRNDGSKVIIAKTGTDICLNALSPTIREGAPVGETDPDMQNRNSDNGSDTKTSITVNAKLELPANFVTIDQNGQQRLNDFKDGVAFGTNTTEQGIMLGYMMGSKCNNCSSGSVQQGTILTTGYSQQLPPTQYVNTGPTFGQVFWPTLTGTFLGSFGGTLAANALSRPSFAYTPTVYSNQWPVSGTGGEVQPGAPGNVYTGGGTTATGTWGNTWGHP